MSRDPELRIVDMVIACEKILRYTAGLDQDRLGEDDLVTDAVLRNIEIIREATKHLPDVIRDQMPGIEWKKFAGMRDWVAHVYDRVDPEIVWGVVESKIPELLRTLRDFQSRADD